MNGLANGHANGHATNGNGIDQRDQPPHQMFRLVSKSSTGTAVSTAGNTAARLGRLALPRRRIVDTPHYLANTSRGVVPHISQDTFVRDTDISGIYVALEDCECHPTAQPPSAFIPVLTRMSLTVWP